MKITSQLREAVLLRRLNRFTCLVKVGGREDRAYLANSGRLKELLIPGQKVLLIPKSNSHRRTSYDLAMVDLRENLVSVDARLPNQLLYEALLARSLPQLNHYSHIQREARVGNHRLDFLLEQEGKLCLLEVKSVTLVRDHRAFFPDAPTLRGRRHLELLAQARKEGDDAAIVFVVQRDDARSFSPHDEVDPQFGHNLREAERQGVAIYAYRCEVSREEIRLADRIPVYL